MPEGIRRFAWAALLLTEALLVAASSAYVGFGSSEFWLVLGAAVVAVGAYAIVARGTPDPKLGEASAASERWYWF